MEDIVAIVQGNKGVICALFTLVLDFIVWRTIPRKSLQLSHAIIPLRNTMEFVVTEKTEANLHFRLLQKTEEVEQLSRKFKKVVAQNRALHEQIIQEKDAKRKYQLEVLQTQITPHFLYNTLNSVVRMVGVGKNEEVITTLTSLSQLFRISLSSGKTVITVQEELEHIRHYLILQKMRYKSRFQFDIQAQEETLACKTVKMLLQPIVENAIYHGIEYMVDEGQIDISVMSFDDKILFQIKDNGVGMSPLKIKGLMDGTHKSEKGSGVGYQNVLERIRLFYGNEYGMDVTSELEVGTTVSIWIPKCEQEKLALTGVHENMTEG